MIVRYLPTSVGHAIAPFALRLLGELVSQIHPSESFEWRQNIWRGFEFRNPIGTAGGVDKDGDLCAPLAQLGFGFLEVGTVTPQPQLGNPGKVMDRDWVLKALWNRMGFPSEGASEVNLNLMGFLEDKKSHPPLFVNIGKNRETAASMAHLDYALAAAALSQSADVFVINVSSPNTTGLRELQFGESLTRILDSVRKYSQPMLVKLSPDLTQEELGQIVEVALNCGIDGFTLTNTTLERNNNSPFPKEGGVSGAPVQSLAEQSLRNTIEILGTRRKDLLLVSVGGILDAADIQKRLTLGADLVQVYSAMVFSGPFFVRKVLNELRGPRA